MECMELEVDMNIKEFYSLKQVMLPVAFGAHRQVVCSGVCVCVYVCLSIAIGLGVSACTNARLSLCYLGCL